MCQKVHNCVFLLSTAIITITYPGLDPQFTLFINWNFPVLLLLFFFLICCLFNSISLEYSRQWNKNSSNQTIKKNHTVFSLSARPRKHLTYVSLDIKLFNFFLSEHNVTYLRTIHKNNEEKHHSSSHSISLTEAFLRNLQCLSSRLAGY